MGDALAAAIQEDHLTWDPSILALLPFPSVLDMMASDPAWTQQLGHAVLTQRDDVMDAVQSMRRKAKDYGYLQPNSYDNVVDEGGYIEILRFRAWSRCLNSIRSPGCIRPSGARVGNRRSHPVRARDHDQCGIRAVGLVVG
jgi:hypothetical protein